MIGAQTPLDVEGLAPRLREEYLCLFQEKDAGIREQNLLVFAGRLENAERPDLAARVYQSLLDGKPSDPSLQDKARQRWAALFGTSSFGLRLEQSLGGFSKANSLGPAILSLAAGSMVFRLARTAAFARLVETPLAPALGKWGTGFAAGLTGYLVEVPTVTAVGAWSRGENLAAQEWAGSLQANALSLAVMRGASRAATWTPLHPRVASQVGLLAGTWLGLRLQEAAGLAAERSAGSRAADALFLTLHFQVAGRLSAGLLGPGFRRWEASLDGRLRLAPARPSFPDPESPAAPPALAALPKSSPGAKSTVVPPHVFMSSDRPSGGGSGSGPSGEWTQRFRRIFPPPGPGVYSEEIIQSVMGLSPPYPRFQERLLEAMSQAPDAGSRSHWISARAMEWIFQANALKSSTAGFDNVLLQEWLQEILKDGESTRRQGAVADLLQDLRTGMTRSKLDALYAKWGLGKDLKMPEAPFLTSVWRKLVPYKGPDEWNDYRPEDRLMLSLFAKQEAKDDPFAEDVLTKLISKGRRPPYLPKDLDEVLTFAREHPQGLLALRRFLHIVAARDLPEKVREILPLSRDADSAGFLSRMENIRMTPGLMASRINGTAHTAYFNHPVLATKVTAVMLEAEKYLSDPARREAAKERLESAIGKFLETGRRLAETDLMAFLEVNAHPGARLLKERVKAGTLLIQVSADHPGPSRISSSNDCVYLIAENDGKKFRLIVRQLPLFKRGSPEERRTGHTAVVRRLASLIHEFEVLRIMQETPAETDHLRNANAKATRTERLIPAVLADLEEESWRIASGDLESWDVARQLGLPLALYLRDKNDAALFRRENERRWSDSFHKKPPPPITTL